MPPARTRAAATFSIPSFPLSFWAGKRLQRACRHHLAQSVRPLPATVERYSSPSSVRCNALFGRVKKHILTSVSPAPPSRFASKNHRPIPPLQRVMSNICPKSGNACPSVIATTARQKQAALRAPPQKWPHGDGTVFLLSRLRMQPPNRFWSRCLASLLHVKRHMRRQQLGFGWPAAERPVGLIEQIAPLPRLKTGTG